METASLLHTVKVSAAQSCPTHCDSKDCTHQAPLSMRFSRQEYWRRLPFPSPGDLPDPGIKAGSPELQADSLLLGLHIIQKCCSYCWPVSLTFCFYIQTLQKANLLSSFICNLYSNDKIYLSTNLWNTYWCSYQITCKTSLLFFQGIHFLQ